MRKIFNENDFHMICKVYFLWKQLNKIIKQVYTRGINFQNILQKVWYVM